MKNNFVAKHAKINRAATHKDKKKESKKGNRKAKHKGRQDSE